MSCSHLGTKSGGDNKHTLESQRPYSSNQRMKIQTQVHNRKVHNPKPWVTQDTMHAGSTL